MSNNRSSVYSIQSNLKNPIKKFTILGERCSGTNFLEQTILENFDVELTWEFGHKHFFGFHQFSHNNKENETLFIGIVKILYHGYQVFIVIHIIYLKKKIYNEFFTWSFLFYY